VANLHQQALVGGRRALDAGILVGLSTYATHESLADGSVERLIQIAIEHAFNEITIFDCIPSGRFLKDTGLILTDGDRRKVLALYDKYHEGDYPIGVVAMSKVNSPEGAGCFGAYSEFYMTAYGDINPCDFNPVSFGNVLEEPLEAIWRRLATHPEYAPHRHSCRMQSQRYRAKYVDPIRGEERLPVRIDRLPGDGTLRPEPGASARCNPSVTGA
jgi:MoaA/NifB/PqqE/SkfB family radical SAM enzyme